MSGPGKALWSTLPLGRDVTLLTHDSNGLAALDKPAGVLSHPNESRDQPRSLLTTRYFAEGEFFEWKDEAGGVRRLWLLNRLDSATSGVILVAAGEPLANEMRAMFLKRAVRKVYNALVFGVPVASHQVWRDRLAIEKRGGQVRTATAGNVPSEAHMRVLRTRRGAVPTALIQLEPKTGRSHQLRVQCAKRHLPIVGDATYGNFHANREFAKATGEKRLFLHSLETSFEYAFQGRTFQFSARAELPAEFGTGA